MAMGRRTFLSVSAVFALAPVMARAAFTTSDLAVSCDAEAAPAVRAAGLAYRARAGIRVRVFPTQPGLLVPQLQREIQNDIILTRTGIIDAAERVGLVSAGGRSGPWRNRLSIVEATDQQAPAATIAVPDFTPFIGVDGPAVLQAMSMTGDKIEGVLDTDTVLAALHEHRVRRGLLFQTDIATAADKLRIVAPVPDSAWPPVIYQAAVTKLARRGDPAAFLMFLASKEGQAALAQAGLEAVA